MSDRIIVECDYWLFECDLCGHRFERFITPNFNGFVPCPNCGVSSWCKDIKKRHYRAGTYAVAPHVRARWYD